MPVIASLNGGSGGGWPAYAHALQQAGAAAIELNIYDIPADVGTSAAEVEDRYVEILASVKSVVTIPVAVKLPPWFSAPGAVALRLAAAGADGLVLFNRFLQPDIDPEELTVVSRLHLSTARESTLPMTWIALLRGRVDVSLAATTGVEGPAEVAKFLLAGADVVMTASALLRHGPEYRHRPDRRARRVDAEQPVRHPRRRPRPAQRGARHGCCPPAGGLCRRRPEGSQAVWLRSRRSPPAKLAAIDAWWRAANYLSAGQIYLMANPLLREPLRPEHVKPRLLGHWGTTPGLNLLYAHLNRLIVAHDADVLFVAGPGHGGPAMCASTWLEGSYTEHWPTVTEDGAGMLRAVPPVLVPRRRAEPRRARDARLDPRGRRARLRARARLRRGPRQPRSDRGLRDRRRRGRDRAARGQLAREQVPQSRRPTARSCRSCT